MCEDGRGGENVFEGTGEAEIRNAQLPVAKRAKPNCILGVLQLLKRASLTAVAWSLSSRGGRGA